MSDIDDYFKNFDAKQKAEYEKLQKLIHENVKGVEEVISYGIPTFKYKGKPLLYFGSFKNHMSIFPASDEMVKAVGKDLSKFRTSKGTLQFTSAKPIPEPMLKEIILFQKAAISG